MDDDELELHMSIDRVASALRYLGTGNAATQMGAIEVLSVELKQGCQAIADALTLIAEAIDNHKT